MDWNARRLAISAGACAVAASLTLGQAAMASAATTGSARPAVAFDCAAPYVAPSDGIPLTLGAGSSSAQVSADVLLLQNRLHCLHYWVGPINGKLGWDTMFAVWAFKEVQSGKIVPPNPNVVDAATQALLATPAHLAPPVTTPAGGATRIEVNKTLQILVLYKSGKVFLITHVSTARQHRTDGNYWITPNGKFYAHSFWPTPLSKPVIGHLGPLWNPVWYSSTVYAIHGDSNPKSLALETAEGVVSLTPASHGCIRIPYDLSKIFHSYIKLGAGTIGTPIYITGPKYQY